MLSLKIPKERMIAEARDEGERILAEAERLEPGQRDSASVHGDASVATQEAPT